MDYSTPGLPVHHQLQEFTQTHVHWVDDAIHHLLLCRSLLLPPSVFPSIGVFSRESVLCIRWPKYWGLFPWISSLHQVAIVLGSCHMHLFFASGGQSIGVSASASVLPVNIQDWFPWILHLWDNLWRKFLCSGKFGKYCVEVKMPKF